MAESLNIIAATIPDDGAAVFVAPLGTTLPTDATTALDAAFVDVGWISDKGAVNTIKRDTKKVRDWSGQTVKVLQPQYDNTWKIALLETSAETLAVAFGEDNVTEGTDGSGNTTLTVEYSDKMLPRQVIVIEFIDGDKVGRHVLRECQATEIADIPYVSTDVTMYELTVDTFKPDGSTPAVATYWNFFDVVPGS